MRFAPPIRPRASGPARAGLRALTFVECLLALVVLAVASLAAAAATNAGHQQLRSSADRLRAVQLAEHLLDEILIRSYAGVSGGSRADWHIDEYDDFSEAAGSLKDALGAALDDADQVYSRSVSIDSATVTLTELEGAIVQGKQVTVTISGASGIVIPLSRFIAERDP